MDEVEVAVMLADISGSTALYEEVGNVEALKRVCVCLDMLRQAVVDHGGEFISSKGDDVLCVFGDAQTAFDVGIHAFESMQDNALSLHAGLDFGSVIRARDDVFGDSVNMAARLSTFAKSGEILCTQTFYDLLNTRSQSILRFFGPRLFKGRTTTSNIYLFSDAPPGQATEVSFSREGELPEPGAAGIDLNGVTAALRAGYETFVCTAARSVTLGRSDDCDIVVPMPFVSRSHAAIEVRQDAVYLSDTSTSGTFVSFDGQGPIHVRRESIMLTASCELSLAKRPGKDGAQSITCDILRPNDDDLFKT